MKDGTSLVSSWNGLKKIILMATPSTKICLYHQINAIPQIPVAFLNRYNKTYNLGHFDTIEEAFNAYKQGKIAYVREVADVYYKEGKITKEVYDALYRYEPKFKD